MSYSPETFPSLTFPLSLLKLLAACVIAVALALPTTLAGTAVASPSDEPSGISLVGLFAPSVRPTGQGAATYPSDVGLQVDQAAGVLYTIDDLTPASVAAYRLPSRLPTERKGLTLDGLATASFVEPHGRGLVVAVASGGSADPATTAFERIDVARNGQPRVVGMLPVGSKDLGVDQVAVGFAAGDADGQLFVLSQGVSSSLPVARTVALSLIDIDGNHAQKPSVLWSVPLPDCELPMGGDGGEGIYGATLGAAVGFVPSLTEVDIGCSAIGDQDIPSGSKPPTPAGVGVVRLSRTGGLLEPTSTTGDFELFPYPGDTTSGAVGIWMPALDRMAFQVYSDNFGASVPVWDGLHHDYVGALSLTGGTPSLALGVNTQGRLYVLNQAFGLLAADMGPTPIDQGHYYQTYRTSPIDKSVPQPNKPLATYGAEAFLPYESGFVVVRDDVPFYNPPPPPDVDANTIDVPEAPGVTGATYTASAQGYGSVLRQVGGENNLANNVSFFSLQDPVTKGTRQLATSYLDDLALSTGQASGEASSAETDPDNTGGEISSAGASSPYAPADCNDLGNSPGAHSGTGGSASCDAAGGSVSVTMQGGASSAAVPDVPGPDDLGVSSTAITASSYANVIKGTVTRVSATARGVSILGGLIRIGEVSSTATVHAHGRPGTANATSSTYVRSVEDVVVAGNTVCSSPCDTDAVADAINTNPALVGRVSVSFPTPDPVLAAGTPGGYQEVVQRELDDQVNDETLDDQAPTRTEVPAMVVTLYEDNDLPSRTVLYLAGVEAEAHYGIYLLADSVHGPPGSGSGGSGAAAGSPTVALSGLPTGETGPVPSVNGQTPALAAGNPIGSLLRRGAVVVLAGVGRAIRNFGVWAVLLLPVYLSARRWQLICRITRRPV